MDVLCFLGPILSHIYFLFQAPQGYQIMMYFPFKRNGLRTSWLGCYHWLELRYLGRRHENNGHRFCSSSHFNKYRSRRQALYSSGNVVRALFEANDGEPYRGFRMCFKMGKFNRLHTRYINTCSLYIQMCLHLEKVRKLSHKPNVGPKTVFGLKWFKRTKVVATASTTTTI